LNLEIDIIIKPGMTARKMPDPPQALLDIIGWYDSYLCQSGNRIDRIWAQHGRPAVQVRPSTQPGLSQSPNRQTDPATGELTAPLRVASVPNAISEDTFDQLRERAVEAEAVHRRLVVEGWAQEDETGVILTRIYRNSDQIKAMMARDEVKAVTGGGVDRDDAMTRVLPLTSDEVVVLRKIWEIGTETVVMQTVAQLDGDIITRIQRGRETAANKPLHDLHREAVANALEHWQFLAQTVATFLSSVLRGFFLGRGSGG
ncbi:MAG: hypothetical protein LC799_07420, partial [Actinobacteria bacterium]|nr:hypothetical protein [Actinomycetota bacterium]